MKKILIIFILFISFKTNTFSQDYKTALGVRLSSAGPIINNSISLKHFINSTMAVEALLSISDPTAIGILIEKHKPLFGTSLSWYKGAGAYIGFNTESKFGAQGILGLDYKFQNVPLNLSLDWKPEINIISKILFKATALGFTARFTFGN